MYRSILFALAALAPSVAMAQSTLLAGWDFQTTTNGGTAVAAGAGTPRVLLASFGTKAGLAAIYLDGTHASSTWIQGSADPGQLTSVNGSTLNVGTGFSTATSGGAAALSLRNDSANGQALTIFLSLSGYANLNLSYATMRSDTGFNLNQWAWSTDGIEFQSWDEPVVPGTTFSTITLSTLTEVNNADAVFLRYTVDGATQASGSNRLDNIQLTATAIPEPSTYAAICGGIALMSAAMHRRRRTRDMR